MDRQHACKFQPIISYTVRSWGGGGGGGGALMHVQMHAGMHMLNRSSRLLNVNCIHSDIVGDYINITIKEGISRVPMHAKCMHAH